MNVPEVSDKRLYTLEEITEALTLRGSLQDQIDKLQDQVAELTAQIADLKAAPREHWVATGSKVFVSKKDAAAVLSISVSSLDLLIVSGEIKVRRMGNRVLIPREQLERLTKRDIPAVWPKKRQGKTVRK